MRGYDSSFKGYGINRRCAMLGPYGGNVIDLDFRRRPGEEGQDFLAEIVPFYNFGRTIRPKTVKIVDDGLATGMAVVEVDGEDALFWPIHFETIARFLVGGVADQLLFTNGFTGKNFFSDTPVSGLRFKTRYILPRDSSVLLIETIAINDSPNDLELTVGDLISLLGPGSFYQGGGTGILTGSPSLGFGVHKGEVGYNGTEFLGWEGKKGLSFLYYPLLPQSAPLSGSTVCITYFGVSGCLLGGELAPNLRPVDGVFPGTPSRSFFTVPAGRTATYRRLIALGGKGIADAYEGILRWKKIPYTRLTGRVQDASGKAVSEASVAVFVKRENQWFPWLHTFTDDQGSYRIALPQGEYRLAVRHPAYNYSDDPSCPRSLTLTISSDPITEQTLEKPFCLGQTGTLELFVWDQRRTPLPARVLLLGEDPHPPTVSVSGDSFVLQPVPGRLLFHPFGELGMDPLPQTPAGAVTSAIPFADQPGTLDPQTVSVIAGTFTGEDGSGSLSFPPGNYRILVTRGPLYHAVLTSITLPPGGTIRKLITLPQVVEVTGYIPGDLHVHAQNSPDSVLSFSDRLRSARAEGVDFFASTDHEFITDYGPKLSALGISLPVVVPGEELTTFDFGHFNAYPLVASPIPLRTFNFPPADETFDAPTLNGGSPLWFNPEGDANLPPDTILEQLAQRGSGSLDSGFSGKAIVQLNHPHNGDFMGLFEMLDLTFDFSRGYDPDLTASRLPPLSESAIQPGPKAVPLGKIRLPQGVFPLTDRWETFEVANAGYSQKYIYRNLNDAIGFLNIGKVPILVGTSDSHNRFSPPIGAFRTYVRIADHPVTISSSLAPAVLQSLRNSRTMVSNGPALLVTATAQAIGGSENVTYGPVGPGETLYPDLAAQRKARSLSYDLWVTITVELQSPIYAPVTEIVVLSNAPYQTLLPDQWDPYGNELLSRLPRLCSFSFPDPSTVAIPSPPHYFWKGTCTYSVSNDPSPPERWFLVLARGNVPMFPAVLQGSELPLPFALTQPFFLDWDGDGYPSDAPCRKGRESSACPNLP
jgi:hypothetical protein